MPHKRAGRRRFRNAGPLARVYHDPVAGDDPTVLRPLWPPTHGPHRRRRRRGSLPAGALNVLRGYAVNAVSPTYRVYRVPAGGGGAPLSASPRMRRAQQQSHPQLQYGVGKPG